MTDGQARLAVSARARGELGVGPHGVRGGNGPNGGSQPRKLLFFFFLSFLSIFFFLSLV
jgi:hypothetical protein